MKHIILATVISLFTISSLFSQVTPKPPKTPEITSTTKSSSYSFSFDTDNKEKNSSISIKRNNNIYKLTARFNESKTGVLKKLLVDKLGNSNLRVSGDKYIWTKIKNGNKLYDCKLTENTLKIYVDKEFSNSKTIEVMNALGDEVKDLISGSDSKEDAKRIAERELITAEKELVRAKNELEKVRRSLIKNN